MKNYLMSFAMLCALTPMAVSAQTVYCPSSVSCSSSGCSVPDGWSMVIDQRPTATQAYSWHQAIAQNDGNEYEVKCSYISSENSNAFAIISPNTGLAPDQSPSSRWTPVNNPDGAVCAKSSHAANEQDCPFNSVG